jgi:2,3,4,5-tetrahydropyridine-2-carboxylate N-succinyltransferase
MDHTELQAAIEALFETPTDELPEDAHDTFTRFREVLGSGKVRAASPDISPDASPDAGGWHTNHWVKKGILVGFRLGRNVRTEDAGPLGFVDKHTLPVRRFEDSAGVRVVPGGSSIREGAYVGREVICMPPMFINIGAYVDDGTLIDSHALVGSCAQIGKRVHLSAAAQIGGVLEPIGALPVIVEDDVLIGGNCGVYEGTRVCEQAVIAAGTVLTRSTPVFDIVNESVLRATEDEPLVIPARAVVVPGSRPATGDFATRHGLQVTTPLIVKYRDASTDAASALEEALRT